MKPQVLRTTTVREEVVYDVKEDRSGGMSSFTDVLKRLKEGWHMTTIMVSFEKRDYPAFGQLPPVPARRRRR